jgi:glutamate N-acetyltransferase/amino-acid N-acetyltransferase
MNGEWLMASEQIQGFKASATAAGIKKDGQPDMTLIFSKKDAAAAGVFTTNKVKAAPVVLSQENIRDGKARAIIANSGNANACTGQDGLNKARHTAELVARELKIKPDEVLVASTGVIGSPLPMERIGLAIPQLAKQLSPDGIAHAAEAIITTDSFPKISRFEGEAGGKPYKILGVAKGAGMIMPHMATMLCFILSDIQIDAADLSKGVSTSVKTTFNRISVDGDTSTNDTVLALANGMAGNGALSSDDWTRFQKGLTHVMDELATMIVKDGEGATKVVKIRIKGAGTDLDALTAGRAIANSYLVKTALYGQDPNWGRIMAALGRSGIRMREEDIHIWVDEIKIVDLQQGAYEDQIVTCDLTPDYIKLNAGYRT